MKSKSMDEGTLTGAGGACPSARGTSRGGRGHHGHQEGPGEPHRRGHGRDQGRHQERDPAVPDEIVRELAAGNRLEFRDFGVFEVKSRRAPRAQNPRTLEKRWPCRPSAWSVQGGARHARVRDAARSRSSRGRGRRLRAQRSALRRGRPSAGRCDAESTGSESVAPPSRRTRSWGPWSSATAPLARRALPRQFLAWLRNCGRCTLVGG
jgi:hypothetical protein